MRRAVYIRAGTSNLGVPESLRQRLLEHALSAHEVGMLAERTVESAGFQWLESRKVSVRAFYMDIEPVSVREFAGFAKLILDTRFRKLSLDDRRYYEGHASYVADLADQPVRGVSWADACLMCHLLGGRLPRFSECMRARRKGMEAPDIIREMDRSKAKLGSESQAFTTWCGCKFFLSDSGEWTSSRASRELTGLAREDARERLIFGGDSFLSGAVIDVITGYGELLYRTRNAYTSPIYDGVGFRCAYSTM